jgi:hypothetical protein
MKKLLYIFLFLFSFSAFSQKDKIKVEVELINKNPYEVYEGREGSQIDYSKISKNFNNTLSGIISSRQAKKQQLKNLKIELRKFINDEIKLEKSVALNNKINEIKIHLLEWNNIGYSLLTKGIYVPEYWESMQLDLPNMIGILLTEIQNLDFFINKKKKTLFNKNGKSSETEIEDILSSILSKYRPQFTYSGVQAKFKKSGRIKKRGKPENPEVVFINSKKRYLFNEISEEIKDSISLSNLLTNIKPESKDFDSVILKLKKYKELLDLGIISKEEYNNKVNPLKKIILNNH